MLMRDRPRLLGPRQGVTRAWPAVSFGQGIFRRIQTRHTIGFTTGDSTPAEYDAPHLNMTPPVPRLWGRMVRNRRTC